MILAVIAKGQQLANASESNILQYFSGMIDKLPFLALAVVILLFSIIVAKIIKRSVVSSVVKNSALEKPDQLADMLGKSAYYMAIVLGLTVSLNVVNVDISFIVGALTFGLGFAMKDLISNYIAGALILLQQLVRIGDLIEVEGARGFVTKIDSRTTEIKNLDGQTVIFPNNTMFTSAVKNYSVNPERACIIEIGVHYDTNLQLAIDAVSKVLKKDARVLANPKPLITWTKFMNSSINLRIKFWIPTKESIFRIRSDILQKLKAAYDDANIVIPFPIRTIIQEQAGTSHTGDKERLKEVELMPSDVNKVFDWMTDHRGKPMKLGNEARVAPPATHGQEEVVVMGQEVQEGTNNTETGINSANTLNTSGVATVSAPENAVPPDIPGNPAPANPVSSASAAPVNPVKEDSPWDKIADVRPE